MIEHNVFIENECRILNVFISFFAVKQKATKKTPHSLEEYFSSSLFESIQANKLYRNFYEIILIDRMKPKWYSAGKMVGD